MSDDREELQKMLLEIAAAGGITGHSVDDIIAMVQKLTQESILFLLKEAYAQGQFDESTRIMAEIDALDGFSPIKNGTIYLRLDDVREAIKK